tara:strand:+ start:5526 stop:5864 length:339 start_codon:yes stop_codon:yes gene_type:complete
MTEDTTYINIEANDFVIRISPHMLDNNEWSGDIDVGMLTTDDNTLNKEDYEHLAMLTDMLIAAIPLMETDAAFRSKLFQLVSESMNDTPTETTTVCDKYISLDDNVVKVKFH